MLKLSDIAPMTQQRSSPSRSSTSFTSTLTTQDSSGNSRAVTSLPTTDITSLRKCLLDKKNLRRSEISRHLDESEMELLNNAILFNQKLLVEFIEKQMLRIEAKKTLLNLLHSEADKQKIQQAIAQIQQLIDNIRSEINMA